MFARIAAAIEAGRLGGDHPGAQVCLWRDGVVVLDAAYGSVAPDGVAPLTPSHLLPWMSATKPIVAVAIARLWERGALDLDDPVARHVPEFAVHDKGAVTIRHLLTHTGGFRLADVGGPATPWDETVARICRLRLEPRWVPGRKAGYHFHTSWFVLGEIVRRLDGRTLDRVVRETIFEPLGMPDSWIGMPAERHAAYGASIAPAWDTTRTPPVSRGFETAAHCAWVVPGGGGIGPAHDLARFYEMLRRGGSLDGARVLSPQTVAALTARHRVGMPDHTFGHVIDWGLGVICDSQHYGDPAIPYGFGPYASPRAFGHGGRESSVGFCDPEYGVAGAIVFDGMPGEPRHDARLRAVMAAVYADLGIGVGALPEGVPTH